MSVPPALLGKKVPSLKDFAFFQLPATQRSNVEHNSSPLVLLNVFDPPMTVPADLREEVTERRDALKLDVMIYGEVDNQVGILGNVTDCRVRANKDFEWYVLL